MVKLIMERNPPAHLQAVPTSRERRENSRQRGPAPKFNPLPMSGRRGDAP